MNKSLAVGLLLLVATLCIGLPFFLDPGSDNAPNPEVRVQRTLATGTLTWYTSIPQIHAQRIANAFTIETDIDVEIVRGATFVIRERIFNEIQRDACRADVLTLADIGTFIELKTQGQLFTRPSPHFQSFPDAFKDDGHWAAFAGFGICMAYDTSRTQSPPEEWTDLLNPRWRGRIGLEDINAGGSQYGQYYMLRETLGLEFWENLLSIQEPKIYSSTEALADALLEGKIDVAGQFSIHTVYDYKIKKKTPIEGIYPTQGIPFVVNPLAILKQSKKMKAAEKFFDFLLSSRIQTLMQRINYKYSLRRDVAPLAGIPELTRLNVLRPANGIDYAAKRRAYSLEFNRLYQRNELK